MTGYRLFYLAPGSYDVLLNGEIVASLVKQQSSGGRVTTWIVELLDDLPSEQRPKPFTKIEHRFATLEDARQWLGAPVAGAGMSDQPEARTP